MCSSPGCLSARTLVTITLHTSITSQRSIYLYLHGQTHRQTVIGNKQIKLSLNVGPSAALNDTPVDSQSHQPSSRWCSARPPTAALLTSCLFLTHFPLQFSPKGSLSTSRSKTPAGEWVFFIWPTPVKVYHSSVIHHGAAEFVSVFLSFLKHFFVRMHQNGPHIIFWYLTMGFL